MCCFKQCIFNKNYKKMMNKMQIYFLSFIFELMWIPKKNEWDFSGQNNFSDKGKKYILTNKMNKKS